MTSDFTRPPEKRYNYRNAMSGLMSLVKEEGLRGLGRGLGTNTVKILANDVDADSYAVYPDEGSLDECTYISCHNREHVNRQDFCSSGIAGSIVSTATASPSRWRY